MRIRRSSVPLLLLVAAWCVPPFAHAQEKKFQPAEVKKIQVGFKTFQEDERTIYKVGLWTPIYVELFGGTDGIKRKPGDSEPPYIKIATTDSEDVGTEIKVEVKVEPFETRTVLGYVKPGHMGRTSNEFSVTLHVGGRPSPRTTFDPSSPLQTDQHLYLTIGSKMTDVHQAVKHIGKPRRVGGEKEIEDFRLDPSNFRNVVYENKVERLPERWFGYNNIDLVILATENKEFLKDLNRNSERLAALAQWVRRGGRLVVPIAPEHQHLVAEVLTNATWKPRIPVVPPAAAQPFAMESLTAIANWGGRVQEPFEYKDPRGQLKPIYVATLDPGGVQPGAWEPFEDGKPGSRPLVAQVRYGLGRITYIAISLEDTSFFQWGGKDPFIESMVKQLATKAPANVDANNMNFMRGEIPNDLATDLVNQLDNFDVRIIEFGYVALFIVLYILVVGPLDFVLLKYVFKRLEWTWITFPTVVLAVSVIAYFAAYALKGRDLKINKVDIVDFDMRTDVDAKGQPRSVRAYGASFFTILSPRIQNYTVGMEANPLFWGGEVKKVKHNATDVDEVLGVDLMSWMGRPSSGMNDMGRGGGSGGFFRRPYTFREDCSGLVGVPIPVWTTKAFCASWDHPVDIAKPPFVAKLVYHQKDPLNKQIKITGTLENHLGVDLVDVWLFYDKRGYPIAGGLKAVRAGAAPNEEIKLTGIGMPEFERWIGMLEVPDTVPEPRVGNSQPIGTVKSLLFHERSDERNVGRNHLLRPLDLGWRMQEAPGGQIDNKTREAILFARVRFRSGAAQSLTNDTQNPLPSKLWIGELPDPGIARPALDGILNQDTFIRVILPVRPADE
jgi:hypothetical protein